MYVVCDCGFGLATTRASWMKGAVLMLMPTSEIPHESVSKIDSGNGKNQSTRFHMAALRTDSTHSIRA